MYFDENNNYFDDYYNIDEIKSKQNNYDIDIGSINFNRNNTLFSIEEGFNKGNMFEDLYSKYKNHVYKIKVNSKKDELLYKIQMYYFALKDLNLYLDVHPTDNSVLSKYESIRRTFESEKEKYEKTYGPLCASENNGVDTWNWIKNPWPWDTGR